jgi:hypothetical protein
MPEDISFNHVRFELTESPVNATSGGNVDLRGCSLEQQLFARDIPAILCRYVHDLTMDDVKVSWTGITSTFFTHGIELEHFDGVHISRFRGGASPANKKAFRISASEGKGLELDDHRNSVRTHVYQ